MQLPAPSILAAFLALFAALLLAISPRTRPSSFALAALSLLLAATGNSLQASALPSLAAAGLLLWLHSGRNGLSAPLRKASLCLLALLALAAALHKLPGFEPWIWMSDFGRDGQHVLRWHYDKGLAALVLLWVLPAKAQQPNRPTLWLALLPGCAALLWLAVLSGQASIDPRGLPGSLVWLSGNLFLTVFAEEAFFRGLLQGELQRGLAPRPNAFLLAAILGALLFGLVHLPWGWPFAGMAVLAGLFYALMAGREASLPRAIAAHFILNALTLSVLRSPLG